jgi:UDP-N-acetylmuramate dehydrogenase
MMLDEVLEAHGKVVRDAPLVKRTWWRAGGPADRLVDVGSLADLVAIRRAATEADVPLFVLGNASNLLISDRGIRGVVVRLVKGLAGCTVDTGILTVGAGLKLVVLTSRMLKHGWTGVEFVAGIPGTVGGAVRMNAGTTLGEVVDRLIDVEVVLRDGAVRTLPVDALGMAYRTCHLPDGAIVASARFQLTDADPAASRASVEHHLERRKATQPIDQPSCGSTFRNPPGDSAGRLIEAAGLKGFAIGAARVSPKHANFIVNEGGATAADIRRVVEHVRRTVAEVHGVALHQEVHYAGDWSGWSG